MADVVASSSASTEIAAIQDPGEMLAKGRRDLLCGEIPAAVNCLQEACRLLAEKHGETANECGDAYYYYGKALLDLARMENGVLGNALQGVPDEEEDSEEKEESKADDKFGKPEEVDGEEKEKISSGVKDAMALLDVEKEEMEKKKTEEEKPEKNGTSTEAKEGDVEMKDNEEKKEDKPEEEKGDETEEKTEGEEEGDEEEEEGEETEEGTEDTKEEEDADDVPNLQLSWEMLELAKIIYEKQENKEMKLKAAQAHLALGEVALETEQYESAIEDFTKCLNIQKENLDPMDRLIAETQYQLGLAYSFNKQFNESLQHYKDAKQVLENRITMLSKKVEEAEAQDKGKAIPAGDDPIVAARKELGDLKEIIPDIETKMEDVLEERRNLDMIKDMAKAATGFEKPAFDAPSSAEPAQSIAVKKASDISNLVRKKRKPEDEEAGGDAENKKPKVNGHTMNGDAEKVPDSATTENPTKPTETAV